MNLFRNALLFEPQNISLFTLLIVATLWLATLVIVLSDLFFVTRYSKFRKFIWTVVVLILPIFGGAIYALSSLINVKVKV